MPLRSLNFTRDGYYHVYNRGSEKRTIYLSSRDYIKFLDRAKENAAKFDIDILCYCLMPNHFHFLLKQNADQSIERFMNALQLGYAKYFNTKYQRVGPLFQGRFKAKSVDSDEYLLQLSAYIHRNPVATILDSGNQTDQIDSRNLLQIQKILRTHPFSSYGEYIGITQDAIAKPAYILGYFSTIHPELSYISFMENFVPDVEAIAPLLANTDIV